MKTSGPRALGRAQLLADLMIVFRRGPVDIVAGDTMQQLRRMLADLKRAGGLRVGTADVAAVLRALRGINASRRYVCGYEFVYEHLMARVSPDVARALGAETLFPPSRELIAVAKSFDLADLPRTVEYLAQVTERPDADADELRAGWTRAMAADGPGAYARFSAGAWRLIYTVALKGPAHVLPSAVASFADVEPYIMATSGSAATYYDVLARAPMFLRVVVYAADANRPGHSLNGVHIPFSLAASSQQTSALDCYLITVLGEERGRRHALFSANRERVEDADPMDVQAAWDRADT